ncbi:hypothetical protein E4T56_gene8222 [Termitomyces sp. T112]|nr:hypothetical protein C0989_003920 [Termitomyces sp. Mn162]KAG5733779.1 hypothetical protein E4T56_gene8222 [Termitomyces sp. T112]KAH0590114.1 hypothetical protein H2248_000291 [Termitomyces sp. 'cryptogamus']KNZ79351.1 hypothetical protein J132_10548 [Termitomyces sp. J132]
MPSSTTLLQPHHLRNLILILRRSNAYYTHVASCIRASFTPTGHAKTRAQNLGLTIDVVAAVNCPHKQVSLIPLPIIEVVTPPEVTRPQPPSVSLKRPALTCSIPPVVQTITSPNGTTSALSTGSNYSSITLASGQKSHVNVHSRWSAITDDGDLFPRDATDIDSRDVRATEQGEPPAVWQPLDVHIDEDAIAWDMDLQYPEDSSMDVCISPSSGSEAGSESSDSDNSESSSAFAGPVTPPDVEETLPLMIRIKRKSMEIHETNYNDDMSDKRMKVFQDGAGRNVIRIPARR